MTACHEAASRLGGKTAEDLLASIHRAREWFWSDPERHRTGRAALRTTTRHIVHLALQDLGIDDLELAREIAERYRDLRDEALVLFPDVLDALDKLKGAAIKLALVTNGSGPAQLSKIERFELARFFDHVQIEGDFGVGKPDPSVYLNALDKLKADPSSAWSVGDNLEWDVLAPKRLGCTGIWIRYQHDDSLRRRLSSESRHTENPEQPDRIIDSFVELPGLLQRWD